MNGPLNMVERDELNSFILDSWTELFKLEKTTFRPIMHMLALTKEVKLRYSNLIQVVKQV